MQTAKQLGEILPAIAPGQITATDAPVRSIANSNEKWDLASLRSLPQRLDDATVESLTTVATSPLPAPEPAPKAHLLRCLAIMDAALPSRRQSDADGSLWTSTYQRMLGHLTKEAVSYVAETAIATCQWMPTIAECLTIAKGFVQPPHPFREVRDLARSLIGRELRIRFDVAMELLDDGLMLVDEFEALPSRWRGMAVESGRVWALRNGEYAICPVDPEDRREAARRLVEDGLL